MHCRVCNAELALEDQFCGTCGAPRMLLLPQFEQVARRFALLRDRYRSGTLDEAAYDAALAELLVEDDSGYWMLGADSGAWYWHNGQEWVRRDPPTGDVSSRAVPSPPSARASRRRRWLIAAPAALFLLCVAAAAVLLLTTHYGNLLFASAAILVDQDDADAYQSRAAAYAELGNDQQAAADYGRAIALDSGNAWLLVQRAIHYGALGRYAEAIADLDQVTALDPGDCFAYLMRGQMYERSGDAERARADYQHVLGFDDQVCFSRQEAADALAEMGAAPPVAVSPTSTPLPAAAPTAPQPTSTAALQADPTPTLRTRELLYYNDFQAAKDPVIGDSGQVRWEGGELRLLADAAGRSIKARFNGYQADDFRLHVTARPVRLYPGSTYGVAVRTDPDLAEPGGGYWFYVRGDGQCCVCVNSGVEQVECPIDWVACPVTADEGNWIVIEAIGPTLRLTVNEVVVAEFEDRTRADGIVVLWVSNDEATTDTLVAFDDLAIFEP
jgi:tetratricopeptide (TPR) repeat protein